MKRFNTTGLCIPDKHYMCDVTAKFTRCKGLVEDGAYFAINYPRQYGKTTMQYLLGVEFDQQEDYLLISTSFEGIGDSPFSSEEKLSSAFLQILAKSFRLHNRELATFLNLAAENITSFNDLAEFISNWIFELNKKVVLIIDEVDKASNNQVFISLLAMLRDKYLDAAKKRDITFHSVVLIGVHDVKSLKLKLRPDEEQKLNSPWNIAVELDIDFAFSIEEIEPMLIDYANEHNFTMDTAAIAKKIYYYTSGNPFLVSCMCQLVDETFMSTTKRAWTLEDIDNSFKHITKGSYTNTNIDDLIKNIQSNEKLYKLTFEVLFGAEDIVFNIKNYITALGVTYGVFAKNSEFIKISNSVYAQIIQSTILSLEQTGLGLGLPLGYTQKDDCVNDNTLDMRLTLQKFQEFMQEFYSDKDAPFLEKHARFILLAFLKPIINGDGYLFKEPETDNNRKMDLVVTFAQQRFIIELKIWRGTKRYDAGIEQLCDYLDSYSLNSGYLLVFNFNKNKKYEIKQVENCRKKITAVFV